MWLIKNQLNISASFLNKWLKQHNKLMIMIWHSLCLYSFQYKWWQPFSMTYFHAFFFKADADEKDFLAVKHVFFFRPDRGLSSLSAFQIIDTLVINLWMETANMDSLDVSFQLLSAAHGPVVSMEGCLHQWSHHASHRRFVSAAVALAIVLHAQPIPKERHEEILIKLQIDKCPRSFK